MMKILGGNAFWGVLLAMLLLLPFAGNDYILSVAIRTAVMAEVAVAWNIIGGYGGMMSFGQSAFFGIGAYTSTILFVQFGISPWLGGLAGAVIAALFAIFTAFLCFHFRLKGWYFGLVTMAFADLLLITAENFFPGQASGLMLPMRTGLAMLQFDSHASFYGVSLTLLAISLLVCWQIGRSRLGFRLRAIRADEAVAEALGVPLMRTKLVAFAISGVLTAFAGTLFAQFLMFIDPSIVMSMDLTIEIVIRALVGGMGTLFGPVLGSVILTPLGEILGSFSNAGGLQQVVYGLVLIGVILFLPHGVLGVWRKIR